MEMIRLPTDFDHRLQWDMMKRQKAKFDADPELREALNQTIKEMTHRHSENNARILDFLATPDHALAQRFIEAGAIEDGISVEDLLEYVRRMRVDEPDFLDTIDALDSQQTYFFTTGGHFEVAKLTAKMTGAYLVTDMRSKWLEIQKDRPESDRAALWEPFAKAFQQLDLKFLDGVEMKHSLQLRQDGRLASMRAFLSDVWKAAVDDDPFSSNNVQELSDRLEREVAVANEDWKQMDVDLLKLVGIEAAAMAGGVPALMSSGHGAFAVALGVALGGVALGTSLMRRRSFHVTHPAAFFMTVNQ
jgi:hypothetical protein